MSRQFTALRMTLTIAMLAVGPLAAMTPVAAAVETASSGKLTAVFSYTGTYPQSHNPHLQISQSGRMLYSREVTSSWCGNECWPDLIDAGQMTLHVVRLQPHRPPSVVLDLFSGGAHCCTVEQVFSLDPKSNRVQKVEHNFGDPGARLVRIGPGGTFDFVSADDTFAYAFTDYAASGMPLEILQFVNNRLRNVTRSFPKLVAHDAQRWHAAFVASAKSSYQDTVGIVAAWVADEDMLGRFASARTFLAAQLKAGHLNCSLSPIEPSGERFVVTLEKFLRAHHYQS